MEAGPDRTVERIARATASKYDDYSATAKRCGGAAARRECRKVAHKSRGQTRDSGWSDQAGGAVEFDVSRRSGQSGDGAGGQIGGGVRVAAYSGGIGASGVAGSVGDHRWGVYLP